MSWAPSPSPPEHGDHGEAADHHEGVGEQVVEGRADPPGRGGLQAEQDEAGVVDRRVGQHPLDVPLDHGQPGADQQGDDGQHVDDRLPVGPQHPERGDEDPQQGGEAAHLGHRGHEPGHRRRRALVDVGRPHVERHGGHLEGEADQQQGHPGQQHPVGGHHVVGQEVGDLGEVGGAGGAVDEGDAVDEDGRGEAAQDEVLERRLPRGGPPVVEGGQHVEGDARGSRGPRRR